MSELILNGATINNLFDLTHTKASDYLAGFTYPWEALSGISDFFRESRCCSNIRRR